MAITPDSAVLKVGCHKTATEIKTAIDDWLDTLTITNIYGFDVKIRQGFYVYTLLYD